MGGLDTPAHQHQPTEDSMKKYKLYDEFCGMEIYGKDLADAIIRAGELLRPSIFDGSQAIKQPPEYVVAVVGYEDVSSSRRGNDIFERALVEVADGRILQVDARHCPVQIKEVAA